jgi:hypothetical protein
MVRTNTHLVNFQRQIVQHAPLDTLFLAPDSAHPPHLGLHLRAADHVGKMIYAGKGCEPSASV